MITKYLLLYFVTHFTYGPILNTYGPIVPYLSQATNQPESAFTFLFVMRGIAYIIAGLINRSTQIAQMKLHHKMFFACFITGIGFFLFSWTLNLWDMAIIVFLMSITAASIEIIIKVCLLVVSGTNAKFIITLSYGIYGLGSVFGPVLVSITGLQSLFWTGLMALTCSVGFLMMKSPQVQSENEKNKEEKGIPKSLQIYFCWLFLLVSSITLSVRSWLPTFCIVLQITDKEYAALSVSVYSATLTIFRLISVFVDFDIVKMLTQQTKLVVLVVCCALLAYAFDLKLLVVFGSAAILGVLFSAYFPCLLALPNKYGYVISAKNSSMMMIFYAIGEAGVSALVGIFMSAIHPIMLFVYLLLGGLVNNYLLKEVVRRLGESQEKEKLLQIEMQQK